MLHKTEPLHPRYEIYFYPETQRQRKPDMTPFATFAYVQEGFEDLPAIVLYRITGGPSDGSDVTATTLTALGIAVPEPIAVRA